MEDLITDIRISLEALADEKRIALAQTCYPTEMHVIGVTVPNLKMVLKEVRHQTKSFAIEEKLKLIQGLVREDVFEMQQLAFEYLKSDKKLHPAINQGFIESIERNLDNWLSVDYFGSVVVGCAWREGVITTDQVKEYLQSPDFWKRRVAIVATTALNLRSQRGTGDKVRTLEICQLVVDDHHDMMVKALSWALRELAKRDEEAVSGFLLEHEDQSHKKVLREVRKKLETGKKN